MVRPARRLTSAWVWGGFTALVALLVLILIVVVDPRWELRNKGGDTTCPHFLQMSPGARAKVIEKMGYDPARITDEEFVADALAGCRRAHGTSDEGDTLDDITGP